MYAIDTRSHCVLLAHRALRVLLVEKALQHVIVAPALAFDLGGVRNELRKPGRFSRLRGDDAAPWYNAGTGWRHHRSTARPRQRLRFTRRLETNLRVSATRSTDSPDMPARAWWRGFHLLRERSCALLVGSNMLASMGTGMLLLLQGWLAVSWGHSPLFLGVFAAARLVPKFIFTVPAGIVCDRISRRNVLFAARLGYAISAVVPLAGFLAPMPTAWLFAGVILAGALHAFDLSSARAAFGDMIDRDDMYAAVALNRTGYQLTALLAPPAAFLLITGSGSAIALSVSAALLAGSAFLILPLPHIVHAVDGVRTGTAATGLLRYLKGSPAAVLLLIGGIVPTFIDKGVALLLPSLSDAGGGSVSMALIAPEAGALLAVAVLAMAPLRISARALVAFGVLYALLLGTATVRVETIDILVISLGLAGMASAIISTTTHATLQRLVPAEMRGRVFAV